MWKDPIVEEVRKQRDKIAKKKDYDLKKIFGKTQKRKPGKKIKKNKTISK